VTWSIEGGDEFGYENVITTHFASAERRPRANNGMQRTAPPLTPSVIDEVLWFAEAIATQKTEER
jgi:hypothetical protein